MLSKTKRRARKLLTLLLTPFLPAFGAKGRKVLCRIVNPNGKLYIPGHKGVAGFFKSINDDGVQYVVLRWFEDLPKVEAGHDLDILVADKSLDRTRLHLSAWPLGQKVDIYSETGNCNAGYRPDVLHNVPAFPAEKAKVLLSTSVRMAQGWAVPAPEAHFLSLAYHAVYLKGYASGLPADVGQPPESTGSRDYARVLTNLADALGRDIERPVTLASLDRMLSDEGWAPDQEHRSALEQVNPWLLRP